MYNYVYVKNDVNVEKLQKELKDKSYFFKIQSMSSDTKEVTVNCSEELTGAEQVEVQQLVETHNPVDMQEVVKNKILKAMLFGKDLMATYGAQNIIDGRTTSEIKQISDKLQKVQPLLESGSLKAALSEIDNITPDELVAQATIDYFRNEIIVFLSTL